MRLCEGALVSNKKGVDFLLKMADLKTLLRYVKVLCKLRSKSSDPFPSMYLFICHTCLKQHIITCPCIYVQIYVDSH